MTEIRSSPNKQGRGWWNWIAETSLFLGLDEMAQDEPLCNVDTDPTTIYPLFTDTIFPYPTGERTVTEGGTP